MVRSLKHGLIVKYSDLIDIDLDDSPCLNVKIDGEWSPVQTSHVTDINLIKNCPAWSDSLWEFQFTTDEWTPIFNLVGGDEARDKLVEFKLEKPTIYNDYSSKSYWVTPKGSPREEYTDE